MSITKADEEAAATSSLPHSRKSNRSSLEGLHSGRSAAVRQRARRELAACRVAGPNLTERAAPQPALSTVRQVDHIQGGMYAEF
jgi:hypothetical protein